MKDESLDKYYKFSKIMSSKFNLFKKRPTNKLGMSLILVMS